MKRWSGADSDEKSDDESGDEVTEAAPKASRFLKNKQEKESDDEDNKVRTGPKPSMSNPMAPRCTYFLWRRSCRRKFSKILLYKGFFTPHCPSPGVSAKKEGTAGGGGHGKLVRVRIRVIETPPRDPRGGIKLRHVGLSPPPGFFPVSEYRDPLVTIGPAEGNFLFPKAKPPK